MPPVSLLSPVHFLFAAGVLVRFHVAKATLQYFLMCILWRYSGVTGLYLDIIWIMRFKEVATICNLPDEKTYKKHKKKTYIHKGVREY